MQRKSFPLAIWSLILAFKHVWFVQFNTVNNRYISFCTIHLSRERVLRAFSQRWHTWNVKSPYIPSTTHFTPRGIEFLTNTRVVVTYIVIITFIPLFTFLASIVLALPWYVSQTACPIIYRWFPVVLVPFQGLFLARKISDRPFYVWTQICISLSGGKSSEYLLKWDH